MAAWPLARVLRTPGTTRLLTAALVARVPDSITATGIVVLARSATGSYSAAGLAAGAFGVGSAISAPMAGRALDRLGQRRVLPVLAVAFAAALTGLVAGAGRLGGGGLAALALIAGLSRPPVEAGLRGAWPRLVRADQLDGAYALDSTLQELIWIGGPLLLAVLLAAGTPRLPLLACAILSIAGTASYATSPRLPAAGRAAVAPARSPLRSARLRVLLAAAACYGAAAGILNVALVAYAAAHGGAGWAGVLIAVWGAGSLAGGLLYGSRAWPAPVHWRAVGCLALFSLALVPLAAAPGLLVLAVLMIPLGLPLSPWLGSLSASVQAAVPAAVVTEAFTWTFAVITVGMAGGSAAAGLLLQGTGPGGAFLIAAAVGLAGAALAAACLALGGPGARGRAAEGRGRAIHRDEDAGKPSAAAGLRVARRVAGLASPSDVITGGAMPDAFEVLRADHAQAEQMLAVLENTPSHPAGAGRTVLAARQEVAQRLVIDSSRHEAAEEQYFWPTVRERLADGGELADQAIAQEQEAKEALVRLDKLQASDAEFDQILAEFIPAARQHIEFEETRVWPGLRQALSAAEAQELGDQLEKAKEHGPTRPHPHAPARPEVLKTAGPVAAAADKLRDTVTGRGRGA